MHLLTTSSTGLDEIVEAIDLGQPPGDIAVLSFADSDLAGLAAAWEVEREALPSVRLAHLRDLRHPMSVDLWIDRVGAHAKVILVRLLGGLDWWKYGIERLAALARERGIALALLPGEDRDDKRLEAASTLPPDELDTLLQFFREGGRENMRALLRRLARHTGRDIRSREPAPVPRLAGYLPGEGAVELDRLIAKLDSGRPVIPIVFYRAMLLAADTAPIDMLYAALAARGLAPAPLVITSLKDRAADAFLRQAFARLDPALIVTTTAFAAGGNAEEPAALDTAGVPVLQVISATTKRTAWRDSPRGLGAADLAIHVVLPELDGRVLAGAVAFKDPLPPQDGLAFTALASRPEPDRIAMVADRIAALIRLRVLPRGGRRVAILMPDYPGAKGRTGYAVGLDVPASVIAAIEDLAAAGYAVNGVPKTPRELLGALSRDADDAKLTLAQYETFLARLPSCCGGALARGLGRTRRRCRSTRRRVPFPRAKIRQNPGRAAARSRPLIATARRLSRSAAAAAARAGRFRTLAAARGEGRRACSHGRAWHAGMAAGQGGGADRGMLSGNRHRSAAGDLSVHRQQSGRGGAGQAPHRRSDHRSFAAAACCRRAERRRRTNSNFCSTNMPRPTGLTAAAANGSLV